MLTACGGVTQWHKKSDECLFDMVIDGQSRFSTGRVVDEPRRVLLVGDGAPGAPGVYQFAAPLTGRLSLNYRAADALELLQLHQRHSEAVLGLDNVSGSSHAGSGMVDVTCTYVAVVDRRTMTTMMHEPRVVPAAYSSTTRVDEADIRSVLTRNGKLAFVALTIHPSKSLHKRIDHQEQTPFYYAKDAPATSLCVSDLVNGRDDGTNLSFDLPYGVCEERATVSNPLVLPNLSVVEDHSKRAFLHPPPPRSAASGKATSFNGSMNPVFGDASSATNALDIGQSDGDAKGDELIVLPLAQQQQQQQPLVVVPQHTSKSAIQQSAAERLRLTVDYGIHTRFTSDQTEQEYQQYHPANMTWTMVWSTTASLISTAALAAVCGIDDVTSVGGPNEPLFWIVLSIASSLVGYIVICCAAQKDADVQFLHAVISLAIQGFYMAAIAVAKPLTIIGDSQMVWLFVMTNWSLHRPALMTWYLAWVRDAIVGALAIARVILTFDIPGSIFLLSIFYGSAHIVYSYLLQWMMEHSRRESFALERHVGILKEEQERDFQDLLKTLTDMVPRGVAGNLVRRAKQRLEFGAAPKLHPAWSTSFCTATDETPFLILQLCDDGTGNSRLSRMHVRHDDSRCPPQSGDTTQTGHEEETRSEQRALATLHLVQFVLEYAASASCPFQKHLQVVKADHDTIMFTAVRWSDDRDDYDEIRSHDVLAFSVDVAKAVEQFLQRKYYHKNIRSTTEWASHRGALTGASALVLPAFRIVAATGPLMGSVIGVTSLSFEYYGAWIGRAFALLRDVEWGSIIATGRVYNLHRLFMESAARGRVASIGRYSTLPVSEVTRAEQFAATIAAAAAERDKARTKNKSKYDHNNVTNAPATAPPQIRLKRVRTLPIPDVLPSCRFRCSGAAAEGTANMPIRVVFVKRDAEEFEA